MGWAVAVADGALGILARQASSQSVMSRHSGIDWNFTYTTCTSLLLAGHKELRFIVDDNALGSAINTTYFPNTLTNY
jgi:hypothetical protein